MAETRTYGGGCHCGRARFEVTLDLSSVIDCNCSICSKRGALWAFAKAPQFKLLKGADAMSDYQFNKKKLHHLFCPTCGIGSYSTGRSPDGEATYAINVRCLDDVDVAAIKAKPFDGKSL